VPAGSVFRWAARQVRKEFRQETWTAFWQTAVEGRPVEAVAKELAKDSGAIYTARSRVMQRIREKVNQFEQETQINTRSVFETGV
jgi:RNA polymerase sigma-70 factor (ECF subfamily)